MEGTVHCPCRSVQASSSAQGFLCPQLVPSGLNNQESLWQRGLHVDNKEQPGQSLGASSDGVEASLSDSNASLLNRASLLTPLNYPGGPCPHPANYF